MGTERKGFQIGCSGRDKRPMTLTESSFVQHAAIAYIIHPSSSSGRKDNQANQPGRLRDGQRRGPPCPQPPVRINLE